jgi:hypothetical protein
VAGIPWPTGYVFLAAQRSSRLTCRVLIAGEENLAVKEENSQCRQAGEQLGRKPTENIPPGTTNLHGLAAVGSRGTTVPWVLFTTEAGIERVGDASGTSPGVGMVVVEERDGKNLAHHRGSHVQAVICCKRARSKEADSQNRHLSRLPQCVAHRPICLSSILSVSHQNPSGCAVLYILLFLLLLLVELPTCPRLQLECLSREYVSIAQLLIQHA